MSKANYIQLQRIITKCQCRLNLMETLLPLVVQSILRWKYCTKLQIVKYLPKQPFCSFYGAQSSFYLQVSFGQDNPTNEYRPFADSSELSSDDSLMMVRGWNDDFCTAYHLPHRLYNSKTRPVRRYCFKGKTSYTDSIGCGISWR